MISALFPETIEFMKKAEVTPGVSSHFSQKYNDHGMDPGLIEVSSFLNIISSLLDHHFLRENFKDDKQQQKQQTRGFTLCFS